MIKDCVENFENNKLYKCSVIGEPQLGKRKLYQNPTINSEKTRDEIMDYLNIVSYSDGSNDLIDLCEILNRVRGPFNINGIAEKAAIVAIKDQKFVKKAADFNTKWISRSSKKLTKLGYKIIPSVSNFYLLKLRDKKQANILYKYLQSNGIIVRKLDAYGINDCLLYFLKDFSE